MGTHEDTSYLLVDVSSIWILILKDNGEPLLATLSSETEGLYLSSSTALAFRQNQKVIYKKVKI